MASLVRQLIGSVALVLVALGAPAAGSAAVLGNVDQVCPVDIADVQLLQRAILEEAPPLTPEQVTAADVAPAPGGVVTGDGEADFHDLVVLLRALAGEITLPGIQCPSIATPAVTPTMSNPVAITGTAELGATVTLLVNGQAQNTTTADPGDGTFSFGGSGAAILFDGVNTIQVSVVGTETLTSNVITMQYDNTIVRALTPAEHTIGDVRAWTPGLNPTGGGPYDGPYLASQDLVVANGGTLILVEGAEVHLTGNLHIQDGGTLILRAGAKLQFESASSRLEVDGALKVQGALGSEVILTSEPGAQAAGDWAGIRVDDFGDVVIDYAIMEFVTNGIEFKDDATGIITNSEVNDFLQVGIAVETTGTPTIRDNKIDNGPKPTTTPPCAITDTAGIVVVAGPTGLSLPKALLDGNEIRGVSCGIRIVASQPDVVGNTIDNNVMGIFVTGLKAKPVIDGGNIITDNDYGVYTDSLMVPGVGNPGRPELHQNQISGNLTSDFYLAPEEQAGIVQPIQAQDNNWGVFTVAEIEGRIFHNADDSFSPLVDFIPFLDAEGNSIDPDDTLFGTLDPGTTKTLVTGSTWTVVGEVVVPSTTLLEIEQGVTLHFIAGASLTIQGTFDVNGISGFPVTFTSDPATISTPAPGDWQGILVEGSGNATIDFATIEFATKAIDIQGNATAIVNDSIITNFSNRGISVVTTTAPTIERNTIDNGSTPVTGPPCTFEDTAAISVSSGPQARDAGALIKDNTLKNTECGILIDRASPNVQDNTIRENVSGIFITGDGKPHIWNGPANGSGNLITLNTYGIYTHDLRSVPFGPLGEPRIEGNSIHGNTADDVHAGSEGNPPPSGGLLLDVQGNWWGTPTCTDIEANIHDFADNSPDSLRVDFGPFLLGAPPGGAVEHGCLVGYVDDRFGPLSAGSHRGIGPLIVPDDSSVTGGSTWTIPAGVTIDMEAGFGIDVEGTLLIQGGSGDFVTLRSGELSPAPGDWTGISFLPGSAGSIDFAVIEHTVQAVTADQIDLTVTNSTIRDFTVAGISLTAATAATSLNANLIENAPPGVGEFRAGTGIALTDSSPAITDNLIQELEVGIHVFGASAPVINGGNQIINNVWGLWVQEGATGIPAPIVNSNDIFGNDKSPDPSATGRCSAAGANYCTSGFSPASAVTLNATNNFWNESDPLAIRATIVQEPWAPVPVDFSGFLDASGGTPDPGTNFSFLLMGVSSSADTLTPTHTFTPTLSTNNVVNIRFTTPIHVDLVEIEIFTEKKVLPAGCDLNPPCTDRMLVRTLPSLTNVPPNMQQSVPWDGKDATQFVPDEAYIYVIEASLTGSDPDVYDPPLDTEVRGAHTGSLPASYNAYRNEYWVVDYDLQNHPSRATLKVTPQGGSQFEALTDVPLGIGVHQIVFDGRDPMNPNVLLPVAPAPDDFTIFNFPQNVAMKRNTVIVDRTTPAVSGPVGGPNVEVKSDPYLVVHSYDQVTRLVYELDQDAYITWKLFDPAGSEVTTTFFDGAGAELTPSMLKLKDTPHTVEWRGYGSGTGASNVIASPTNGAYTFLIQAESTQQPNLVSEYRGVIQVRQ